MIPYITAFWIVWKMGPIEVRERYRYTANDVCLERQYAYNPYPDPSVFPWVTRVCKSDLLELEDEDQDLNDEGRQARGEQRRYRRNPGQLRPAQPEVDNVLIKLRKLLLVRKPVVRKVGVQLGHQRPDGLHSRLKQRLYLYVLAVKGLVEFLAREGGHK